MIREVTMTLEEMQERREYLTQRLRWLGVRSDGSERLEMELQHIDMLIARKAYEGVRNEIV